MIVDYGFSLIGKSHIAKGTCCQDNHKIKKMDNGWYIAAIADGVGSAKNSQIGSKIATETVVSVCEEYMPWDYNVISIKSMLRTAYNYAFKQILRESQKSGEPIESYDTTLTMVIYNGHKIIYGHSGDGAIIGLNTFGNYVNISKPQKGLDGITVVPLRAGYTTWKIDTYEEELAAVLLMTDGMLDIFCPYLLKDITNGLDRVYVPIASFFGDPICFLEDENAVEKTKEIVNDFLNGDESFDARKYYSLLEKVYKKRVAGTADRLLDELKVNNYPLVLMQGVQDDKTVVGLINTEVEVDNREESFYREPDWQKLQDDWNRKAYPHLYSKETASSSSGNTKKKDGTNTVSSTNAGKMAVTQKQEDEKKETFVPLIKQPESDKAKQAIAAYGRTSRLEPRKPDSHVRSQSVKKSGNIIKKESVMEKHDKPRKKSLIDKIGDALD